MHIRKPDPIRDWFLLLNLKIFGQVGGHDETGIFVEYDPGPLQGPGHQGRADDPVVHPEEELPPGDQTQRNGNNGQMTVIVPQAPLGKIHHFLPVFLVGHLPQPDQVIFFFLVLGNVGPDHSSSTRLDQIALFAHDEGGVGPFGVLPLEAEQLAGPDQPTHHSRALGEDKIPRLEFPGLFIPFEERLGKAADFRLGSSGHNLGSRLPDAGKKI